MSLTGGGGSVRGAATVGDSLAVPLTVTQEPPPDPAPHAQVSAPEEDASAQKPHGRVPGSRDAGTPRWPAREARERGRYFRTVGYDPALKRSGVLTLLRRGWAWGHCAQRHQPDAGGHALRAPTPRRAGGGRLRQSGQWSQGLGHGSGGSV